MVMEDSGKTGLLVQRGGESEELTSPSPNESEIITLNNSNPSLSPSTSPTVVPTANGLPNVYLIGLEFVRQYYTVLHQGPLYLHRFYSEQSAFVHDDSRVVYGQVEICDRIKQLNFRNCVAKILQVDSQETLDKGVVIQVRGELSNNGKPMRGFMQTFVLAPQTPKRYYVRNDIFHYQDDEPSLNASSGVASSNENAEDEKSEEEDLNDELGGLIVSAGSQSPTQEPHVVVSMNTEMPESFAEPVVPEVSLLDANKQDGVKMGGEGQQRRPSHGFVVGATGDENPSLGGPTGAVVVQEPEQGSSLGPSAAPVPPAPVVTGAKTYANLFKSGLNTTGTTFTATRGPFPQRPSVPSNTTERVETTGGFSPAAVSPQPPVNEGHGHGRGGLPPRGHHGGYGRGGDRGGYMHRNDRDRDMNMRDRRDAPRERLASRSSTVNEDNVSVDGDGVPRRIYPDSHQLFVGNLPQTVASHEIADIFNVYGRVAEVKILRPNQKNAGAKVPYFCFVVYEDPASAALALVDKAIITMKMSDGTNRRLNVEEKRPRESNPNYGSSSGSYYQRDRDRENGRGGENHVVSNNGPGPHGGNGGPHGNSFRAGSEGRGGGHAGGLPPRAPHGSGGPGTGGGLSGDHRSQQNQPRTHSRTFRGSNRGGGGGSGERGGGSGGGAR